MILYSNQIFKRTTKYLRSDYMGLNLKLQRKVSACIQQKAVIERERERENMKQGPNLNLFKLFMYKVIHCSYQKDKSVGI